jgi:pimeloyl-ACP methyl ester carboxylesterase
MKQTIILIHGYGFDERSWSPLEVAFDAFQVVRFSLPGFGSSPPQEPYSIESLAQQFWSELDVDPAEAVHLVGHSMGGYVCMEMAAQQPHRLSSLTLLHSHVFADTDEKKKQRSVSMEGIKKEGRAFLVKKMIPSLFADQINLKPLIDVLVARGMMYDDHAWLYGAQAMRDRKDHSDTLKNIPAPVLMIMGEKDNAVPLELAYRQASISARTKLHVYPDIGHVGMYENTSQLICDLLTFYSAL